MQLHRIYCPIEMTPGAEVGLPPDAARHVVQALRLRSDDQLILFNGSGSEWECRLTKVTRTTACASIGSGRETGTESTVPISVWHGICRGARMDSVVQKATELGASSIQPMITAFGVVKLDANRSRKRLEHWRKVAISAAEQSGRGRIPEIMEPTEMATLLQAPPRNSANIIFDPDGNADLQEILRPRANLPIIVCTGPEGGFSATELEMAGAAGFHKVALGPRILRTETAPIVALSLVQHLVGDLRVTNDAL